MREVRTSELQPQLVDLLDDVERGETIVITRDGRPVARLVPEAKHGSARSAAADVAVEDLKAWRRSLPASDITLADILSAREEGRR